MANLHMNIMSESLGMATTLEVIVPDDGHSRGTLYLLHGLTDDGTAWSRYSAIEQYARERSLSVVMPTVGRSWYADTAYGPRYFTYLCDELPALCRRLLGPISDRRETTFIGGLSMGGYGALKAAFTYPERYAGAFSLSGAVDIAVPERPMTDEWRANFGFELSGAEQMVGSSVDVPALCRRAAESRAPLPRIYLWCGTEDHNLLYNRRLHAHLDALGISHTYRESYGNHTWPYWNAQVCAAIDNVMEGVRV